MFLVLIAKRYKRHVCVLLANGGIWCTTQWIQTKDCEIVLVACVNEVDKTRYFSATCELVTQEGITDSKKMHQQEARSKFEQEMEHFIRSVPEKVPIRSTSEIRKRSLLNVNTKFLNKKAKVSKPFTKSHLGNYKVKSTTRSTANEDGTEVNESLVEMRKNDNNGKELSQPISKTLSLVPCLNDASNKIYKMKTIDLENIKKEIEAVKAISKGLTKYCSDIGDIIKQLGEAVDEQGKKSTEDMGDMSAGSRHILRKPYKWQCKSFRTTTDLLDHKKIVHEGNKIVCMYNGCNKTFANQNAMKKHLIQHTKEKMKMCDQCCKMFHHDSDVKHHVKSHMDPEYECDKCQKKYRYKSQLTQHLKVWYKKEIQVPSL